MCVLFRLSAFFVPPALPCFIAPIGSFFVISKTITKYHAILLYFFCVLLLFPDFFLALSMYSFVLFSCYNDMWNMIFCEFHFALLCLVKVFFLAILDVSDLCMIVQIRLYSMKRESHYNCCFFSLFWSIFFM